MSPFQPGVTTTPQGSVGKREERQLLQAAGGPLSPKSQLKEDVAQRDRILGGR